MAQRHFVVQDVVRYVHDDHAYSHRHSFGYTFKKMLRQIRVYLFVALLSGGVGYAAVCLPDLMKSQQAQSFFPTEGNITVNGKTVDVNSARSKLESLSEDQKQALLKKYMEGKLNP